MRRITSQLFRDDARVEAKRADRDYAVQYVELECEGETLHLVIDGHHSHEAAKLDGVEPEWVEVTADYASEIEHLGGLGFCDAHDAGEGWWELETGQPAW